MAKGSRGVAKPVSLKGLDAVVQHFGKVVLGNSGVICVLAVAKLGLSVMIGAVAMAVHGNGIKMLVVSGQMPLLAIVVFRGSRQSGADFSPSRLSKVDKDHGRFRIVTTPSSNGWFATAAAAAASKRNPAAFVRLRKSREFRIGFFGGCQAVAVAVAGYHRFSFVCRE